MKKTLLSIIAGLAVVNAASAVPSIADRKTMCEKHPDKYVWVTKTEACVPIDPCAWWDTDGDGYGAYCLRVDVIKPKDSYAELLIGRFLENTRGTMLKQLSYIGGNKYAVTTTDGDYRVFYFMSGKTGAEAACWAYGKKVGYHTFERGTVMWTYCTDTTESECSDIGDFVNLLYAEGMYVARYEIPGPEEMESYGLTKFLKKDVLNRSKPGVRVEWWDEDKGPTCNLLMF